MLKFFTAITGFCCRGKYFDNQAGMLDDFEGMAIAIVAGYKNVGIEEGTRLGNAYFGIGDEDSTAFASQVGSQCGCQVDGDGVVGQGAPGHGVGFAIQVLILPGLLFFPVQVFLGRQGSMVGDGYHNRLAPVKWGELYPVY